MGRWRKEERRAVWSSPSPPHSLNAYHTPHCATRSSVCYVGTLHTITSPQGTFFCSRLGGGRDEHRYTVKRDDGERDEAAMI